MIDPGDTASPLEQPVQGGQLRELSDSALMENIGPGRPAGGNAAVQAEMMRRQILAIREFNAQSSRQATVMIWLTVVIAVLTVVLATLTFVMLWR